MKKATILGLLLLSACAASSEGEAEGDLTAAGLAADEGEARKAPRVKAPDPEPVEEVPAEPDAEVEPALPEEPVPVEAPDACAPARGLISQWREDGKLCLQAPEERVLDNGNLAVLMVFADGKHEAWTLSGTTTAGYEHCVFQIPEGVMQLALVSQGEYDTLCDYLSRGTVDTALAIEAVELGICNDEHCAVYAPAE